MGYLVCEKCGGYYELQEDESIDDFKSCQCGGKLKYVKNLNQLNPESNKHGKISLCSFCGTENLKDDKFCGNCGKPLTATVSSEVPPKAKTKITDRLSKYQNKRNYSFFAIGVIGIAFIAFLLLWLPGTIFANHYDDGVVSFDYSSNFNVTKGQNTSYLIDSGTYDGTVAKVYGGVNPARDAWSDIFIIMYPMNHNVSVPVNQTNESNNTGNISISPANETTVVYKNETVNVLNEVLDQLNSAGIKTTKSTKNGYTYYEVEGTTYNSKWLNTTDQATIIQKDRTPYFFVIGLQYNNNGNNYNEAINAYKQIITTFKVNTG